MFEKSISHAMISYFNLETLLLGNMLVQQTILQSWNERREESFPAPTQAYYPHLEGNKYPYQVGVLRMCHGISIHIISPIYQTKISSVSQVPKGTSTSTQHPISQRSPSPVSPISRWQKWYTIWCKKLWPTSASHKPSGWPRRGREMASFGPPFLGRKSSGIARFASPSFLKFVEWSEWSITANFMNLDRPANQPTQQTKRPTATGVIKVYGFDVQTGRHLYAQV